MSRLQVGNGGKEPAVVMLPLGGVDEVGANCTLYGFGAETSRRWIMVDCGLGFTSGSVPGVDTFVPDLTFVREHFHALDGIFLTHGHEDHIGGLLSVWSDVPVPVYTTPFTRDLLKIKCSEAGVIPPATITVPDWGDLVSAGPFNVRFMEMEHSIPHSAALLIETPLGQIFHSGDWRSGVAELERLSHRLTSAIGDPKNVSVLVCDSTNANRPGQSGSESDVSDTLRDLVASAPARVAVTLFSSNVGRIAVLAEAAQAAGRKLLVFGRALRRIIDIAQENGTLSKAIEFLDVENFNRFPAKDICLLLTGSQGEPRAALAKIAFNRTRLAKLEKRDRLIFSSRSIPGNEVAINQITNALCRRGVEVITSSDANVHVSGHPRQDDLTRLHQLMEPESFIPVHGEARHLLAHSKLASALGSASCVIPSDGDLLHLLPGSPYVCNRIPAGRVLSDGNFLISEKSHHFNERHRMANTGHIVASIVCDIDGHPCSEPQILARGLPMGTHEPIDGPLAKLHDRLPQMIFDLVDEKGATTGFRSLSREIARRVRKEIKASWGKEPTVDIIILKDRFS